MTLLDTNNDGHIDVTEFLVAIRVSIRKKFKRAKFKDCQAETATVKLKTKPTLESEF